MSGVIKVDIQNLNTQKIWKIIGSYFDWKEIDLPRDYVHNMDRTILRTSDSKG